MKNFSIIAIGNQVQIIYTWTNEDGSIDSNVNTFDKTVESDLIALTLERVTNVLTHS